MNRLVKQPTIAVIGLGYVGLPLAVEFGKQYRTIGFDINQARIDELSAGDDCTLEFDAAELKHATQLTFTHEPADIGDANVFIVTVPTPIDQHNRPDLRPLGLASTTVGKLLKQGDVVIYESTVYPGATEEYCVPLLSQHSGLAFNRDFHVGYSPERINPGDKEHSLTSIIKVTAGSNQKTADYVDELYNSIITAGTHKAQSINVAEAAKVIENTQRDVNIALMNELAMIFNRLDIETDHVLQAASSKWNFLPFKPGLVGGHCISVDPYYLAHKAQEVGHDPQVILSGRRINDGMGLHVASSIVKLLHQKDLPVKGSKALILGLAFKENTGDVRNSKVVDVYQELKSFGMEVDVHDPLANPEQAMSEYGITLIKGVVLENYQAILLAVPHESFHSLTIQTSPQCVVYDLKGVLPRQNVDKRL